MRLIDADVMSEKLQQKKSEAERLGVGNMAFAYFVAASVLQDAPTIDAAPAVQWISVEERLPEKDKAVLVCLRDQQLDFLYSPCIGFLSAFANEWRSYNYDESDLPDPVAFWMPLPEVPEAGHFRDAAKMIDGMIDEETSCEACSLDDLWEQIEKKNGGC